HAFWDGWSFDVFLAELDQRYQAHSEGKEPQLPALPIQYGDFCAWSRAHAHESDLQYWVSKLSGELPVLEVPADFPRPEQFSYRGETVPFELDADLVSRLTSVARSEGATLFMLLVTAYK